MFMKYLIYTSIILFLLPSCQNNENLEVQPEIKIYQVDNNNDITIPVTIEDFLDGTGYVYGNLLFDNTETQFNAIFDYVNDDKTNFSLDITGSQISSTFVSGSGYFTNDSISISISIFREIGGLDLEEVYIGSR